MKTTTPTFPDIKKIVIGSTNPVKINAVKNIMTKIYPNAKFEGRPVKSDVSDQPRSDAEARQGAHTRAQNILNSTDAEIAVGLEGGITDTDIGMFTCAWCCIVDRSAKVSFGGGMHLHLPHDVAYKIRKGGELGPIMDDLLGESNWKNKGGAMEIFSAGLFTRTTAYSHLVELALSKFVAAKWYK